MKSIRKHFSAINAVTWSCILVFWLAPNATAQQNDSTAVSEIGYGIHDFATGSPNAVDAYDVTSMYSNPSSLIFLSHPTNIVYSHLYNRADQSMIDQVTMPVVREEKLYSLALGFQIQHASSKGLEPFLGISSFADPLVKFDEYGLSMAYSRALSPTFSIGILASGLYGSAYGKAKTTGSIATGIFYQPNNSISYGIVYHGIGQEFNYSVDSLGHGGFSAGKARDLLEIGISMHFYTSYLSSKPIFDLSIGNEKDFRYKGLNYKIGLAVRATDWVSALGGFYYTPRQSSIRMGLAFHFHGFGLIYAVEPRLRHNAFAQQFSITYKL